VEISNLSRQVKPSPMVVSVAVVYDRSASTGEMIPATTETPCVNLAAVPVLVADLVADHQHVTS